jgi:hypothetical protein
MWKYCTVKLTDHVYIVFSFRMYDEDILKIYIRISSYLLSEKGEQLPLYMSTFFLFHRSNDNIIGLNVFI